MTLLGTYEDGDYRAEFGTLVVRGFWPAGVGGTGELRHLNLPLLAEDAFAAGAKSDVARAGAGWVLGTAAPHAHVRLEAYDAPPGNGAAGWSDVLETPFLTSRGEVGLAHACGGVSPWNMKLAKPGLHRLRVLRRRTSDGHRWLLQFWPVTGSPGAPRFLARSRPAAGTDRPGHGDKRYGPLAMDVLSVALWSPGRHTRAALAERLLATPEQVREALRYLTRRGMLRVGGADTGPASTIALVPQRSRPPDGGAPPAARPWQTAAR
ncbi:hypothetical protein F8568_040540 [Actinomadura sp. LD22]|uniref:Uncharacterized protein n=1 Tax=Actinomadura physcomitrii TaxID=2650748 RepID=A0A6I4ML15_9ACTN|nr:hypothetical protein [Actinomadura physcomitrii]MWA06532.1 hypothetical protein [Actinomadura physcomitrii]